ncbi:MAG: DUF1523 family protein [Moraxellaceae bacterium]
MGGIRKAMMVLAGLLLLMVIGVLAYALPQHRVVHVDGYEVKRVDGAAPSTGGSPVPPVRGTDVYFIHSSNAEGTEVFVYRNEDTGFGFPWYLKFDSAEVQGRAQLLGQKEEQLALVTYYGWRVPVLKLFPNAVNIEAWDSTEEPFPVFNTVFLGALLLLVGIIFWKLRKVPAK